MLIQRLTGLVVAATVLHLNVARAELACASHHAATAPVPHAGHAPSGAARGVTETGSGRAAAHSGVNETESCESPAAADCCQALAACAPPLALGESHAGPAWITHGGVVASASAIVPPSRAAPPEPPPPRV